MRINDIIKTKAFLFDGAMGTLYAEQSSEKCELANLNDRETILKIHKSYIDAGCNAIKTNTFSANTIGLNSDFKLVKRVIEEGCKIAFEAVENKNVEVFADIGPIINNIDTFDEYCAIIDVFKNCGVKNYIFETFGSDEYVVKLAKKIKNEQEGTFIITQFAVAPDGFTREGLSGELIFNRLLENEFIDALGFNCVSGPHHLSQYIKKFNLSKKPVALMPNAGYPTVKNNRTFFEASEEYFAEALCKAVEYGVKIIGGCCGTTPKYILNTAESLKKVILGVNTNMPNRKIDNINNSFEENKMLKLLSLGKKPIAVELDPPADTEIDFFMKGAAKLKKAGVSAITIADCPLARARVDSSLLACKLKRELDITAIPHMTCRDRNINATKALLLGLNIEGVEDVLTVTGDPVPSPLRDEVKTMFSFNSSVLARFISELNDTIMKKPFHIYGALNVNVKNFDAQLKRAENKIENGVKTFLTQPILTEEAFNNLKRAKETLNANIFGGIIPIVSHRNACFMNNEISGINVCDEIINMYENIDKEEATKLAIKISISIAEKIRDYVDGYYIITPFKRIDIIEKIIEGIK